MKCLPASKLPESQGIGLHDWHAEILAIRSFNHFLLQECLLHAQGLAHSGVLRRRSDEEIAHEDKPWHGQPFSLKDGITLHMYCSEAPCEMRLHLPK